MPLRPDRLTIKSQEALQAAQQLAQERQHQELLPEHLLLALVRQKDGVVGPILQRAGVRPPAVEERLGRELSRVPRVTGAEIYVSSRLARILDGAWREAQGLKDEYVSTEHLFLATAEERDGAAGRILRELGLTRENILILLRTIRGTQRVTDQEPEE